VAGSKGIRGEEKGLLVMDDTTLDNPYAQKIELVTYHMDSWHEVEVAVLRDAI